MPELDRNIIMFPGNVTLFNTTMTMFDGNTTMFDGNMTVFDWHMTVMYGNKAMFNRNVTVFQVNMTMFYRNVTVFQQNMPVLQGNMTMFHENVTVFQEKMIMLRYKCDDVVFRSLNYKPMNALEKKKYIINSVIVPFLKQNGFKRKNGVAFHFQDELDVKIVKINSYRIECAEFASLDVRVALFNESAYRFFHKSMRKVIVNDRYINFSFAYLLPHELLQYEQYEFYPESDLDVMSLRVFDDLCELMSFFKRLQNPLEYLKLVGVFGCLELRVKIHCMFLLLQQKDMENARLVFKDIYDNFTGRKDVKANLVKLGEEYCWI